MNYGKLTKVLLQKLEKTKNETSGITQRAQKAIVICRQHLTELRKKINDENFKNENEEIYFFKEVKHAPLSQLIYNSEIQNFEVTFPKTVFETKNRYIKKYFESYNEFFLRHIDFGQYIAMGYTHFDDIYFTRKSKYQYPLTFNGIYLFDSTFNTPRDFLLAQFKAYELMIQFLRRRKVQLEREYDTLHFKAHFDIKYTASKIDIVELIYALHASKAVLGDLKELVRAFEIIFNVDLGDFYRTFVDIRNRNNEPAKFLDTLKTALLQRISELDN